MGSEKEFSVLIVDDEKTNLDVLNFIMKDRYVVYIAKSGEAALRKVRENRPDLILLDVIMPEMDGFEVIAHLKASADTCDIPIIFITGLKDPASEDKGIRLGASDYISKPFNPAVVLARVGTQLKILEQIRTIERMEMLDRETKLANAKRFDLLVQSEWRRAVREKTPLSVLAVRVEAAENDTLRRVADLLSTSATRPADVVARLDGNRFGILMPNTDADGAKTLLEEIRARLKTGAVGQVSTGIASFRPGPDELCDDFQSEFLRISMIPTDGV